MSWPLDQLIHLRQVILHRYLVSTKGNDNQPALSSSDNKQKGWFSSMSSWISGKEIPLPQVDAQDESTNELLPSEAPVEEVNQWKEKGFELKGLIKTLEIIFDTGVAFSFDEIETKFSSSTSKIFLALKSAFWKIEDSCVLSLDDNKDLALSFTADSGLMSLAVKSPEFHFSQDALRTLVKLIGTYPVDRLLSSPSSDKKENTSTGEEKSFDLSIENFKASLPLPSLNNRLSFCCDCFKVSPSEIESKYSVIIDNFEVGSSDVSWINVVRSDCHVVKTGPFQTSVDAAMDDLNVRLCPDLLELPRTSIGFMKSMTADLESLMAKINRQTKTTEKRRDICFRVIATQGSVTFPDPDDKANDFFISTLRDVELRANSNTNPQVEMSMGAFSFCDPSENSEEYILSGFPNGETEYFFELSFGKEDNGSKVIEMTMADIDARVKPIHLNQIIKIGQSFSKFDNQNDQNDDNSPVMEVVATLASLDLKLLPNCSSSQKYSHLTVRDFRLLKNTTKEFGVGEVSLVFFGKPDKEIRILSSADVDSSLQIELCDAIIAKTNSLSVFLDAMFLEWVIINYVANLKMQTTEAEGNKNADKALDITIFTKNTLLYLEEDFQCSVSEIKVDRHHLFLEAIEVKKSSIDLTLFSTSKLSISSLSKNDETEDQPSSLVEVSSDRLIHLWWSVTVENMLKNVIGKYAQISNSLPNSSEKTKKSNSEVNVVFKNIEIEIMDPLEPMKSISRCLMTNPNIKFLNFATEQQLPFEWELSLDCDGVQLADNLSNTVMFEVVKQSQSKTSRSNTVPLSSSYPGDSSIHSFSVHTNQLLKPLPKMPDFNLTSEQNSKSIFQLKVTSEKISDGSTKRQILVTCEEHCNLSMTVHCLPTLLESCGMGAKMFPVITEDDRFGRPMHKLKEMIKLSPDSFDFIFSTDSVNCRLLHKLPGNDHYVSFASAIGSDGIELAFSTIPNVHKLQGSFTANSISLYDDSKVFGEMYSCRAIVKKLDVSFTKAGLPDYQLDLFDNDVCAKVVTESVKFIHTKRIFVSILDFVDLLMQKREKLARIVSQKEKPDVEIQTLNGHGARMDLEFHFNNPAIVVPNSFSSPKCLLIKSESPLTATSKFAWEYEAGTNLCEDRSKSSLPQLVEQLVAMKLQEPSASDGSSPFPCLINILHFDLTGLTVYDGLWKPDSISNNNQFINFQNFIIEYDLDHSVSSSPFPLVIHMERNLDGNLSRHAPDLSVAVLFDNLTLDLSEEQCSRIFGLLDKNFGEDLGGPPPGVMPENMTSWKNIETVLYAQKCNINLLDHERKPLARVQLDPAAFSFSRFSNNLRSIDFKCPTVLVTDLRSDQPQVVAHAVEKLTVNETMQFELNYSNANDLQVKSGFHLSNLRFHLDSSEFWQRFGDFVKNIAQSQPPPRDDEKSYRFSISDGVVSRTPLPDPTEKVTSFKLSLHRTEVLYKHEACPLLLQLSSMLVMTPGHSLTMDVPSLKLSTFDSKNNITIVPFAVASDFTSEICHEKHNDDGSEDRRSPLGIFEAVGLQADLRCDVSLGSVRINLNPKLIATLKHLSGSKKEEPIATDDVQEKGSPLDTLLKFYPELAKIKVTNLSYLSIKLEILYLQMNASSLACNVNVESTPVLALNISGKCLYHFLVTLLILILEIYRCRS